MSENNDNISIAEMDKAEVLAALYKSARPQGMGFLQFPPGDMAIEQARDLIREAEASGYMYFDYPKSPK